MEMSKVRPLFPDLRVRVGDDGIVSARSNTIMGDVWMATHAPRRPLTFEDLRNMLRDPWLDVGPDYPQP